MSDKPAAAHRADLVRKVLVEKENATFSVDNESYQILLDDCTAPLIEARSIPSEADIRHQLQAHGYESVVSTVHVLGHWAHKHPLHKVVRSLPAEHMPTKAEINNALKGAMKDMRALHANTTHTGAKAFLAGQMVLLEQSGIEDVVNFRQLCMISAIEPFDRIYAAEPMEGKPLH